MSFKFGRVQPWTAESKLPLTNLKIFLYNNIQNILMTCCQVSNRCPLGYLFDVLCLFPIYIHTFALILSYLETYLKLIYDEFWYVYDNFISIKFLDFKQTVRPDSFVMFYVFVPSTCLCSNPVLLRNIYKIYDEF